MLLYLPGTTFDLYTFNAKALYKIWFTKLLLPEPDTPVTKTRFPKGNLTFMFFKLFSFAPFISINLPLPLRRFKGTSIFFLPLK